MAEGFERVCKALSAFALVLSAVGLLLMTVLISWQVFARYVLNSSPSWTEQAALLTMLWFILFAAAAGVREGFHIRLSLLEDLAKPRLKRAMQVGGGVTVLLFGLAMCVQGGALVLETWSHTIPALGLPRGIAYIPISAAGAMIVLFSVERMLAVMQGRELDATWS